MNNFFYSIINAQRVNDISLYPNEIPTSPDDIVTLNNLYSSGIGQQDLLFDERKTIDGETCTKKYLYTANKAVEVPNDVTYSAVTEFRFNKDPANGADQFEGCTVTNFYNDYYDAGSGRADQSQPFFNDHFEYGEIKSQTIYDKDFIKLQETTNVYTLVLYNDPDPNSTYPENAGVIMAQNFEGNYTITGGTRGCYFYTQEGNQIAYYNEFSNGTCPGGTPLPFTGLYSHYYNTPSYGYTRYLKRLTNTTTSIYENSLEYTTSTDYTYGSNYLNLATEIITTDSTDKNLKSTMVYVPDKAQLVGYPAASEAILAIMEDRNQIALPVQVTKSYQDSNNAYFTLSQQRMFFGDFASPNQKIFPLKVEVSKGNDPLVPRINYIDYDPYGNLTEVSIPSGAHNIYIWGYQGDLLLAEIKNSSYINMPQNLKTDILNIITNSNAENTPALETALRNSLITLQGDTFFNNSEISIFTHDPGKRVTSVTDPRGYTTFYYYDQHNRLNYATDQDGNVLSKNEYNLRINN